MGVKIKYVHFITDIIKREHAKRAETTERDEIVNLFP